MNESEWEAAGNDAVIRLRTERDEAREDAASWERVATEQQDRAMVAEKHLDEAREEQREACAKQACRYDQNPNSVDASTVLQAVRATPLASTPLRDRIAELEGNRALAIEAGEWRGGERDEARAELSALKAKHHAELMAVAELAWTTGWLTHRDRTKTSPRGDLLMRQYLAALVKGGG